MFLFAMFFRVLAWLVSKSTGGRWSPRLGLPQHLKLTLMIQDFLGHLENRRHELREMAKETDLQRGAALTEKDCKRGIDRPAIEVLRTSFDAEADGFLQTIAGIQKALAFVDGRIELCKRFLGLLLAVDVAHDGIPVEIEEGLRTTFKGTAGKDGAADVKACEATIAKAADELGVDLEELRDLLHVGTEEEEEALSHQPTVAIERTPEGRIFRRPAIEAVLEGGNGNGNGNGNGRKPAVAVEEGA